MNHACISHSTRRSRLRTALPLAAITALVSANVGAVTPTDISQIPLVVSGSAQVKPNIMLLMDNSGSMGRTHMPDEAETVMGVRSVGYKSSQCNALYFNPATNYLLPKKYDGTFFPTPTFTAAPYSGYASFFVAADAVDLSTSNLNTDFVPYDWGRKTVIGPAANPLPATGYAPATPGAAYYYVYAGPEPLKYDTAACKQADTGAATINTAGGGVWTRTLVSSRPAAEQNQFAMWFSYYRTRLALTKSAASLAFAPLDVNKRVGFITVEPKVDRNDAAIASSRYLQLGDFATTALGQKDNWYRKLFSQVPSGVAPNNASPTREGLARVGRYYGGKTDSINTGMGGPDPVQYACQQNFTVLTTDGYWNGQSESPGGGGLNLDATALVGQQDGLLLCTDQDAYCKRPIYDGNSAGLKKVTDKTNNYPLPITCALDNTFRRTEQQQRQVYNITRDTVRTLQRTVQYEESSSQLIAKSEQTVMTVKQTTKTVDQFSIQTDTPTQDRYQVLMSQDKIVRDTEQFTQQKRQQFAQTLQNVETVSQTVAHNEQWQTSSSQYLLLTTQFQIATINYTEGKEQVHKRQWQWVGSAGEDSGPLPTYGTCPSGYACFVYEVYPTGGDPGFVDPATCPLGTTVSGNDPDANKAYVHTECTAGPQAVASRPVAACSAGVTAGTVDPATFDNGYVKTTCDRAPSGSSYANGGYTPATCTPSSQMATSPFTITTCTTTINTSQPQAFCSVGPAVTEPSPTHVTTQCIRNYTPPTNSAPCNELAGPQTDGSLVTTTCTKPVDQVDVPAPPAGAGCTNDSGTSSPFQKVTCSVKPVSSAPKAFASCTAVTPTSSPWIKTTCVRTPIAPTATATAVPWGGCTSGANSGAYLYDTDCTTPSNGNNQTVFVASADCGGTTSTTTATSSPWVDVICARPAGSANMPGVAWNPNTGTCPSDPGTSTPFARSTCMTVDVMMPPVAVDESTCTATSTSSTSPFVTTHCVKQGVAGAFACPGTAPTGPPWIYERCGVVPTYRYVPFGSCTSNMPTGVPYETCRENVSAPAPIATCVQDLTPSGNNPRITCSGPTVISSGPVDPATCPATQGQQGGTNFYDITCTTLPAGTYATPTGVQTCPTPAYDAAAGIKITCSNPAATNFALRPATPCSDTAAPVPGDGTNAWTTSWCKKTDTSIPYITANCPATAHAQSGTGSAVTCVANGGDVAAPANSCTVGTSDAGGTLDTVTGCTSTQGMAQWANYGPSVCTSGNGSVTGEQIACRNVPVGTDVADANCSISGPDANGLIITCPHVGGGGYKYRYTTTTTVTRTQTISGVDSGAPVSDPPVTTAAVDIGDACYPSAQTVPSPPLPAPQTFPAKPAVDIASCTAWPCTETATSPLQSDNSLADVAQYYYTTDLRPLMANVVRSSGTGGAEQDNARHQHMTTFVVALGVSGTLQYNKDYWKTTQLTGDFAKIRAGTLNWPVWPDPALNAAYATAPYDAYNDPKSIDDFWHTAVNGRGRYFSANDPTTVITGLSEALAKVDETPASGAADAISSLSPVPGNNFVYGTSYVSGLWTGELQAFTIDTINGTLSASAWSAQGLLDARTFPTCDNRKIFLMRANALVDFAWNTDECPASGVPSGALVATPLNAAERANFSPANIALLSQFTGYLPTDPQLIAAEAPGAIVNFLRGQRGNEDYVAGSTTQLFRKRAAVLGDLVDSQPVYVQQPFANYLDAGYGSFKTNNASRPSMVYVGGNDGMLHAFNATVAAGGGQEAWAVIPGAVLPKMVQLADANYERGNHQFFVDGTPVAADVCSGACNAASDWHTILVGGLNAGGKGYYALDITDPAAPAALWEFKQNSGVCPASSAAAVGNTSDCNLGLSFGKPIVTKLNSTWVVMFTSGYNNLNGVAGDGGGFLYVVNAMTGAVIHKIATGAGAGGNVSGLAQINNYVDNVLLNNNTLRAYGGDLLGNIWRFEFSPAPKAVLVGTAENGGSPQPITTRPELAEINGQPFVMVGTGRLLGDSDVADSSVQSVYGVNDRLASSPSLPGSVYPSPLRSSLQQMTMTQVGLGVAAVRTIACSANCTSNNGWVVNLAEAGERVNVDMRLVLGTLVFASNVPEAIPCRVGGHSWFNQLDFRTGTAVSTAPVSGTTGVISNYLDDSLNVGINVIQLQPPSGANNPTYQTIARQGDTTRLRPPTYVGPPLFQGKRISWREIVQ